MSKCPFCKSENIEDLNTHNSITFDYEKESGNMITGGKRDFPYKKYLCLNCGMIYEQMKESVLNNYNEISKYLK